MHDVYAKFRNWLKAAPLEFDSNGHKYKLICATSCHGIWPFNKTNRWQGHWPFQKLWIGVIAHDSENDKMTLWRGKGAVLTYYVRPFERFSSAKKRFLGTFTEDMLVNDAGERVQLDFKDEPAKSDSPDK